MDIGEALTQAQMDEYREAHAARLSSGLPRSLDIAGTVCFLIIVLGGLAGLTWAITH